jgi:hypothetical protein
MSVQAVFAPVFVLAVLTFVLMFWTGHLRVGAVRRGETRIRDIALGEPNWPVRPTQAANAFDNQFQLPVLFYVLVLIAHLTKLADFLFVILAWLFVATRVLHAGIHVTSNRVSRRFFAYLVGAIVLLIMWVMVAIRLFIFAL